MNFKELRSLNMKYYLATGALYFSNSLDNNITVDNCQRDILSFRHAGMFDTQKESLGTQLASASNIFLSVSALALSALRRFSSEYV